ncbi:MAG: hypothetical protein L6V93_07575 [Clostridiales bacterium]|nr:MAG: hypothetical protein L6V93_07575 [Clostridiales bacterium]
MQKNYARDFFRSKTDLKISAIISEKFIYLIDALDDLEKDKKEKSLQSVS